jgi:hypothetical protein
VRLHGQVAKLLRYRRGAHQDDIETNVVVVPEFGPHNLNIAPKIVREASRWYKKADVLQSVSLELIESLGKQNEEVVVGLLAADLGFVLRLGLEGSIDPHLEGPGVHSIIEPGRYQLDPLAIDQA